MENAEILVNGKISPTGIQNHPVFSWRGDFGFAQKSYRLTVYNKSFLLFDSGIVESGESQWIDHKINLESAEIYTAYVTLYDSNGYSYNIGSCPFETALLKESDWKASWICAGKYYRPNWAMYYRKNFTVNKEISSARLYFSGLGAGVPFINGIRVGD